VLIDAHRFGGGGSMPNPRGALTGIGGLLLLGGGAYLFNNALFNGKSSGWRLVEDLDIG
jgi:prohibitin 2